MFDKERFKFALENYKKDFPTWWQDEKYKWEAVKCFQDNWKDNVKTEYFYKMLVKSLSLAFKTPLLTNKTSLEIIMAASKNFPEKIQNMFNGLFREKYSYKSYYGTLLAGRIA